MLIYGLSERREASQPGRSAFCDDEFCQPKSKNASKNKELYIFWPELGKIAFYATHMHVRLTEFLGRVLTMLRVVQALLLSVRGCSHSKV